MAKSTKIEVTKLDEARVLKALRDSPSYDIGLPVVTVGWRCGRAGNQYAQRVLEHLLKLGQVERFMPPPRIDGTQREPHEELWRAIER